MFSAEYYAEIKAAFDGQMALLDERLRAMEQKDGLQTGLSQGLSARLLRERKVRFWGRWSDAARTRRRRLYFFTAPCL